ncbi:hypothetical protein E2986_07480 [Frieseomelitta varia]|uniref:Class II aldolase/adducin N-terminal domain-containing protein n=1 Tax=Frieseomelitta varia TaxID=561572 RepID=A0A833SJT3_9HYME|nr:hypothetical protein E2986_07480 [Frieseomelitta varia]
MADPSQQQPLTEPHTNGVMDGLTEEEKSKMRPADIDADMREMERRKRVEMMMNSRLFREELERIIETQMKDGAGPSGLLQQISDMMGAQGARFNGNVFKNSNCVLPINDIRGVESMGYAKGEKLLRCKLAAVFRLLDLYGWTQGVGGQITARLNQDQEHFLVNPYGLLYHEVTASSLIKVDMQGTVVEQGTTNFGIHVAGFQLHSTIHAARPDIKCIVHITTPSVTAISSLKCGLLPIGQESIVIGEVSTHQYIGGFFEPEEKEKIARNLGPMNKVMLLTNRGALCCGETVEEAFFNVYNMVLACETQLKLMPAGLDNLNLISEESKKAIFEASRKPPTPQQTAPITETTALSEKLEKRWRIGGTEFEALMRMLDNAWVSDGSPTHSSTPVKIDSALQFVPKNTNPKEFKQIQQQIKDYRRADKISAGPQSHILEGVTWEEAKKMQDATISGTGEQVVLVGAASKGIIQRGFQHNAMVYKTPYAKNPFDAVTDQELDQYKREIERKQKGDIYDESQSESEALSSFNVSRATHESSTAKSPIQSPVSVTSETEEESRDDDHENVDKMILNETSKLTTLIPESNDNLNQNCFLQSNEEKSLQNRWNKKDCVDEKIDNYIWFDSLFDSEKYDLCKDNKTINNDICFDNGQVEIHSNEGSDMLELSTNAVLELLESSEEYFRNDISNMANEIIAELNVNDTYMAVYCLVNEIFQKVYDIVSNIELNDPHDSLSSTISRHYSISKLYLDVKDDDQITKEYQIDQTTPVVVVHEVIHHVYDVYDEIKKAKTCANVELKEKENNNINNERDEIEQQIDDFPIMINNDELETASDLQVASTVTPENLVLEKNNQFVETVTEVDDTMESDAIFEFRTIVKAKPTNTDEKAYELNFRIERNLGANNVENKKLHEQEKVEFEPTGSVSQDVSVSEESPKKEKKKKKGLRTPSFLKKKKEKKKPVEA